MLRELVAPAREQLAFSDCPAQPLAPDQVRVSSLFGAAKHGTEMAMYRGYAAPRGGYDGDYRLFTQQTEMVRYPIRLGNMCVGDVVETGSDVQLLRIGDRVVGHGSFRQEHVWAERSVRKLPDDMPWQAAVCLDPADFALGAVRDGHVRIGDAVAVFGMGAIGLMAVQLRPGQEQVLIGGSDGTPKLYKIFRTRKRIIGDDFNHIRSFKPMPGRIFDLQFSPDGKQFVAGSSTGISGSARIYTVGDYDTPNINNKGGLGEVRKQIAARSAQPRLVHELPGIDSPIFAVAYRPDGQQIALGGFDGKIRLYDAKTGKLVKTFVPVKVTPVVAATK